MAVHSALNREVVGSYPTSRANLLWCQSGHGTVCKTEYASSILAHNSIFDRCQSALLADVRNHLAPSIREGVVIKYRFNRPVVTANRRIRPSITKQTKRHILLGIKSFVGPYRSLWTRSKQFRALIAAIPSRHVQWILTTVTTSFLTLRRHRDFQRLELSRKSLSARLYVPCLSGLDTQAQNADRDL